MVSRENFGRRSRTGSRPYLCQARARRLNRAWRDRRIGAGLRNRRSEPHGRPRRHPVLAEISSFFAMTPFGVATALWVIWALSWLLAAVWSSRSHSSAGSIAQLPYRLITTAGFVLPFRSKSRTRVRLFLFFASVGRMDHDCPHCCRICVCLVG